MDEYLDSETQSTTTIFEWHLRDVKHLFETRYFSATKESGMLKRAIAINNRSRKQSSLQNLVGVVGK